MGDGYNKDDSDCDDGSISILTVIMTILVIMIMQ